MSGQTPRYVKKRFPDRELQIARLERGDRNFRDLCRDYEDCTRVLEEITRNPAPDLNRIKEYRELKSALEGEILEFLARPSGRISVFQDDQY
jgi:hypothetical protein